MAFDHAVVLGGSIGGLLAAAALRDSFAHVTIVERDELLVEGVEAARFRSGVAHGDQLHHLLSIGRHYIEKLLPGLDDELVAQGCTRQDYAGDFASYSEGMWLGRAKSDLMITCFQRPFFEWLIRRRVLAMNNVSVQKGVASGLVGSRNNSQVVGAVVKGLPGDRILGDLVVDSTGRGSRAGAWIRDLGYSRPEEIEMRIHVGYVTLLMEFPDGVLPDGIAGLGSVSSPDFPRGANIRPCGGNQFMVMAYGMSKDYPPADMVGFMAFLDSLPLPKIAECVRRGKPLTGLRPFRLRSNLRRLWEQMERRPEGFVVIGDAVASFNPRYGQGLTMAAIGGNVVGEAAKAATGQIEGLASSAQNALSPWVDIAFDNAVRLDATYPGVEYENMEPPQISPEIARAMTEIQTEDTEVLIAVKRAGLSLDNSLLRTESIQKKIADWISSGRQVRPEIRDPRVVPGLL